MTKLQDLLNGKIPEYSGAIIIPVENKKSYIGYDPKDNSVTVTSPTLLEDNEIIEYAESKSQMTRLFVCVGYPFWNGDAWEWKMKQ